MGDQTDLGDGTDAGDGRVNGSRRERRLADVPEAFGHGDDLMPAPASAASREASRLIEEHLDLVNHVVFQVAVHFPRHVDRDELVRAGALGLVEAAQRYDGARGVPFNRFAAQRIRGAIIDAVRSADWAPRSVRTLARRLDQVEQRLAGQLGRVPSIGETADALGMSRDELDRLRDRIFRSVVLAFEHLVGDTDDEELTLVDILADPDEREPGEELEVRELHSYLREAIALLPERHRVIVLGYFIEERTSEDLARYLGVTESRVSQMRTEALGMLRMGIEAQYVPAEERPVPDGLVARRRARYVDAISAASEPTQRISLRDRPESDLAFVSLVESLAVTAS